MEQLSKARATRNGALPINLIGSCSDRKRFPVTRELRLGSSTSAGAPSRPQAWIRRLQEADAPTVSAAELYAGDHWAVLRGLSQSQDADIRLSIVSAGYGLIQSRDPIKPYSATFALGGADSVHGPSGRRVQALQSWWSALSRWPGPGGGPRTLKELATRNPGAPMIIVASGSYLVAVEPDLRAARDALADPSLLIVCSVGSKVSNWVADHQLPVDSRLTRIVGGSSVSLNARLARFIIQSRKIHRFQRSRLERYLSEQIEHLAPISRPVRVKLTDEAVARFIRNSKRVRPGISSSAALRLLRERGLACEQSRFGDLFRETSGGRR